MTIQTNTDDTVELEYVGKWDVRVTYRTPDNQPGRGDGLAQAMDGRFCPGPRVWWMTPARAQKWLTLYLAGWSARKVQALGRITWVLDRPGEKRVTITDAVRRETLAEQTRKLAESMREGAGV